ncbi:MAG: cell filamentation protein Fic [Comamonadaceae bacterium PBBC1]|nr:MAG: cell filamentation protein Fic [Comamonadaceae bacterium PBBC1]
MYLWQSPYWPEFQVDLVALQPALASARYAQGRSMGLASHLQLMDLGALELQGWADEAIATAQIEGEILQVNSVRASAARRLGMADAKALDRDARTEATLDVLQAAIEQSLQPLSHETLYGWQAALFPAGRSGIQKIRTGAYRDHAEPMQIVTPRMGKPDIVHYQAPDSADVHAQMTRLIDWFNSSLGQTDGLVRAALAHLWIEAIHPFEDGNGRVGRALIEMALAQDLKTDKRLWSLSQQMWLDRAGYYAQLQVATGQAHMDVTPWVQWFVGCVHKAADATWDHMQAAMRKTRFWSGLREQHPQLTLTQTKAINKLYDVGPDGFTNGISTEKYVNLCRVSRATAYRELTALCEMGVLVQTGTGRGTRYKLSPAVSESRH